jgi:hypothetical protein
MNSATKQEQVFAGVVRKFAGDIMSGEVSRLKANVSRAKRAAAKPAELANRVAALRAVKVAEQALRDYRANHFTREDELSAQIAAERGEEIRAAIATAMAS